MSRTHKDLPGDGRTSHSLLCPGHGVFNHDPVQPDPEDCFFCSVSIWTRLCWRLHVLVRALDEACLDSKAGLPAKLLHGILKPFRGPLAQSWTEKYLVWHAGHTSPEELQ